MIEISSMPMTWGPGVPAALELRSHILLLQLLDSMPVQLQLAGYGTDRSTGTAPPHVERKAFGVQRVGGQPGQPLPLHLAAGPAPHPPNGDFQVDTRVATGQIPNPTERVVVKRAMPTATRPTECFFPRRWSGRMRTFGSPKTPRTVARGRNPGKRYVSSSRRGVRIRHLCQLFSGRKTLESLVLSTL